MPLTEKNADVCTTCGAEIDTSDGLGCMVCLLRVGLDEIHENESDDSRLPPLPDQFGPYTITRHEDGAPWELGRGAMGVTYRAIDASLDRPVALKIIQADLGGRGADARERFMREARAAAALRHPNIATVYHFGIREETGQCFYAMELVEGETLDARVRRLGPLEVGTTIEVARQITEALGAAEKNRLVHRDLKPANLMIVDGLGDGEVSKPGELTVKVIDFGVAKALTETTDPSTLTRGGFVGTPAFASPEQWKGAPIDVRSDIYSLGATLWFLLTGHLLFRGRGAQQIREGAPSAVLPVEQLKAARVPARVISLLVSMLAFEPAGRPGARDLATRLERISAQLALGGKQTLLFAAAALLVIFLGAGTLFVFHPWRTGNKTLVTAPEKSIAVLPFENLSDDPANAYFASGLQEDVLVNLSKIAELKVIDRNSVLPYKDGPRDVRGIGKTLGVSAILQGSVRRAGTRARINVHLIDTETGREIWADNFDREVSDVFAIQSDLSLQIASALKATLSPMESAGIKRQPTQDAQAYLLYVQANDLFAGHMKARMDLEKAEQLFEKAIGLDPQFALALAQLSQLETIFCGMYDPTTARLQKARTAAQEALRLQPDLPEAHMAMGRYYWQGQKHDGEMDLPAALQEFQKAESGLPGSAELQSVIARVKRQQGKWLESLAGLEKAASLDPNTGDRWHRIYYGNLALRRYPAAAKALDRAIALSPNSWLFELHRAWLQLQWRGDVAALKQLRAPVDTRDDPYTDWIRTKIFLGNYDEAEKVVQADPREGIPWGGLPTAPKSLLLGNIAFAKKDGARAREYLETAYPEVERAVREAPLDADRHMVLANVYVGLGRKEEAIREGKRACELLPESKDAWFGVWMADNLADLYVRAGETEMALLLVAHSLSVPAGKHVAQLRVDPLWEPLRTDPRFQKLLDSPPPQVAENDNSAENKSIAVLPFESIGNEKEDAFLARGIHDDLLANLSRIGQLKVISRNSILPYKATSRNLRQIGNALGVRTVLEGSVRRAGSRAHISVQLIDATNDTQIWADSFDREMTDLFSVQSDLAVRIAAALQLKLSPAERASIETPPTRDAEAYDFYLRGRELLLGSAGLGKREENLSTAIDLLNRAVARDPNFALGYCLVAELHLARFRVSRAANMLSSHDPADLEKVLSNLEIAFRLAPDLGEAHLVRGRYFYHALSDYKSASAEFSVARRALPNNAECFHLSGLLERRLGRWNDGLLYLLKAVSLDPQNATAREDLASTYYLNRNFAKADRVLDQAILAIPENANYFRLKKARVGLVKGDLEGARAALQSLPPDYEYDGLVAYYRAQLALYFRDFAEADRILVETVEKLGPKKTEWWVVRDRAFVARAEGDRVKTDMAFQTALRVESEMRNKTPDDPGVLSMIALFQAALGRKEEALREMRKAVELLPIAADAVDGPAVARTQALVYAWCGEGDRALEQLALIAKIPSGPDPGVLKFDPAWDILRGDARFQEIVAAAAEPIKID
jgi:serine/threonine-protein kinase